MSKTFDIDLKADAEVVVEHAKAAAGRHGADFTGDRFAGKFSGNGIRGHYTISGQVATVTISEKPELAPWPMVENAIRGFFDAAAPAAARKDPDARFDRRSRAEATIKKHVLWSSGAGLIPVPVADLAAVTAIQVAMLESLSRLYDLEFSEATIKNFIAALTGGIVARLGASFVKAIPGIGSLIGGASMAVMSAASTYAVGHVVLKELEAGHDLSKVDIARARAKYEEELESGKKYVADLKDKGDD